MVLLTEDIRRRLLAVRLGGTAADELAQVRLVAPWCGWAWYPIEVEDLFFGLVQGNFVDELCFFTRTELDLVRGPSGEKLEFDSRFRPTRVNELRARLCEKSHR